MEQRNSTLGRLRHFYFYITFDKIVLYLINNNKIIRISNRHIHAMIMSVPYQNLVCSGLV